MTDVLQPPGRTISYFPELTKITGSIKAAILCQQITYYTPREDGAETWIQKSQAEWLDETGFTIKEFRGAVEELEERKLIRKRYDRVNHVLEIELQIENYNALIQGLACGKSLKVAPAKRAGAKRAGAARDKKAPAKRADGIRQKGTWHVPKGDFVNNVVKADVTTEGTTEKDIPPSDANASDTPKGVDDTPATSTPAHATRGTRIPEDWHPSANDLDWATEKGYDTLLDLALETEEFCTYWRSQGSRATKRDWSGTWKVRMIEQARKAKKSVFRNPRASPDPHYLAKQDELDAEAERKADEKRRKQEAWLAQRNAEVMRDAQSQ
jgi:hypothetical protein